MQPMLMAELAQDRQSTLLRAAEATRLARAARAPRTRKPAGGRPRFGARLAVLSRRAMPAGPSVAACCA
jgi:hypothetical protein